MYADSHYNELLFSGGVRSRLHLLRFEWARRHIHEWHERYSLFELGCYDCRSVQLLPKPSRYVGADANWENGLTAAQERFKDCDWMTLVQAGCADDLNSFAKERFDYSLSLETIEHIPPELVDGYIAFLAAITHKKLLISVPVEVGPVFLAKYLCKMAVPKWRSGETSDYTRREVWHATIGDVGQVARDQHKGFDYRRLVAHIERYFTIESVEGIPFQPLPYLSFQAGIVATPKAAGAQTPTSEESCI